MKFKYFVFLIFICSIVACNETAPKQVEENSSNNSPANLQLEKINKAIAKDGDDASLYQERAKIYFQNEALDEAVSDMNKALQIDSLNGDYYGELADIYMYYYKSRLAVKTMDKAVRVLPENIDLLLKKAEIELTLKMNDVSLESLSEALKKDPQNAKAYFLSGLNFREKGNLDGAISLFQKAVDNDPDLIDAWIILGDLHDRKDDPIALKYFETAMDVDPNNIQALHSLAFYWQNHGKIIEAIEIYKKINVLDPSYAEAYFNTGILYLEIDSFAQAYQHFNIAVNNSPTLAIAYFYRGLSSEKMNNYDGAENDYNQALKFDPKLEPAIQALENLK
jgi:tetratricopeptide (TPR) repeat protein